MWQSLLGVVVKMGSFVDTGIVTVIAVVSAIGSSVSDVLSPIVDAHRNIYLYQYQVTSVCVKGTLL